MHAELVTWKGEGEPESGTEMSQKDKMMAKLRESVLDGKTSTPRDSALASNLSKCLAENRFRHVRDFADAGQDARKVQSLFLPFIDSPKRGLHRMFACQFLAPRTITRSFLEDGEPSPTGTMKGCRSRPDFDLPPSSSYLDWSLVEPSTETETMPNLILPTTTLPPVLLKEITPAPRYHGVPVYIISGVNVVRQGILLSGTTHIATGNRRGVCPAWTLVPTSPNGR